MIVVSSAASQQEGSCLQFQDKVFLCSVQDLNVFSCQESQFPPTNQSGSVNKLLYTACGADLSLHRCFDPSEVC